LTLAESPLHAAVQEGNEDLALLLIHAGCKSKSLTSSIIQCNNFINIIIYLVPINTIATSLDKETGQILDQLTPLHLSVLRNDVKMTKMLLKLKAKTGLVITFSSMISLPLDILGRRGSQRGTPDQWAK